MMAAGEVLHEKKQATHRRSAIGTDLLVSRRECERAGQRALDYIVSRALLTMAELEG